MDTHTPHPALSRAALVRIVSTVSAGFVITQLDVTIVNVALARIGIDLRTGVAGLQWIVDAYTLALAGLMLSAGALGDRFGARRLFAAGLALFAVASFVCGIAANATTLIAARALQGFAAAAMLPNSLALLNRACAHDPRLRARAVGWWTASGAISIAAGPVIGGMLIAQFGWRSIFFVNLPLCAAGLAATLRWIDKDETSAAASGKGAAGASRFADSTANTEASRPIAAVRAADIRPRGIDLPGQCLAAVALTLFTGAVIDWHPTLVAVALAAAAAFVFVESRSAHPMMPLALFKQRTFSVAVLFGVCMNLSYYGIIFVLSLYLQRVRHDTPLEAGLAFLPLTGGFLLSNVASGWATAHYGARRPMIVGALIGATGFALLSMTRADTPVAALVVPFLLIPGGMGLAVPAMTTTVLASVERARAATASAVLNTARQAGGAIGVAGFGALASGALPAQIVSGLRASALVSAALFVAAAAIATAVRGVPHRASSAARTKHANPAGADAR
ncbi:MFS transporter [Burkholderia pseudomallei]|uniref:MFS transporter n=1 Tax=Burkholderia pseudomallei TaxID=28450 RepID=UPI000A1A1D62|nr:MFS transporter [Burkholderia pseudomallei]ARL93224.1 MFS transporter [Burkholderia pseudomallei]ARM03531.1 MFS transporter [Burkholderia pseudomallei]MEB5484745.1 MFS transporter [Burkholderia pseudomallei]MEB5491074.1 MFS transporter [Burkholderia pseudomallei]MEB5498067.1 MFS transporter [Burkholderia pseudomallei]